MVGISASRSFFALALVDAAVGDVDGVLVPLLRRRVLVRQLRDILLGSRIALALYPRFHRRKELLYDDAARDAPLADVLAISCQTPFGVDLLLPAINLGLQCVDHILL